MTTRLATALLSLSLCAVAPAQGQLDELTTIDGKTATGRLRKIDEQGRVHLAKSADRVHTYELANLRRVRLAARKATGKSMPPGTQWLCLRSGLRLTGKITKLTVDKITFDSDLSPQAFTFTMRHVRAVRTAGTPMEKDGGFSKYLAAPKDDRDVFSIRKGDRIVQRSGALQLITKDKITYEARGKLYDVPLSDLYGIVRAQNTGVVPDRQPRPRVTIAARGGEVLGGRLLRADGNTATLRLDEGIEIPLHLHRLSEVQVQSDRLVYLTDLEPIKVEQTPAFDRTWPWMKGRSPSGAGIELGGVAVAGLVLVPKTRLTYRIDGRFDTFEARIGIEDRSKGPAHAVIRVLSGDKVLFESKPLTRQTRPQDIRVKVTGLDRLTIEADFGKNFDFGDHCVFADARLVKQAGAPPK